MQILHTTVPEILFFRLPLTVCYYRCFRGLTVRTRSAVWTEFYDAFLAPAMSLTVVRSLCKPFGVGFRVTDKAVRTRRLAINRKVALPFAVLFALHVAGLAYSVALGRHVEDPESFRIVAYFAAGNLAMLWFACSSRSIFVGRGPIDGSSSECRLNFPGMMKYGAAKRCSFPKAT